LRHDNRRASTGGCCRNATSFSVRKRWIQFGPLSAHPALAGRLGEGLLTDR
jgi:hypothetical protein